MALAAARPRLAQEEILTVLLVLLVIQVPQQVYLEELVMALEALKAWGQLVLLEFQEVEAEAVYLQALQLELRAV